MALTLHYHPLSSYCWKLLIALTENGAPFEARVVNLGDPGERASYSALWPTAKIPLLVDGERAVPETSIQIEYLDHVHPGRVRLLPPDFETQLKVRLWDRLFDLYVMDPVQRHVAQWVRPEGERDAKALIDTADALGMAYDMIEARMGEHTWAAGNTFTLADCAAAPALFYAMTVRPLSAEHRRLCAYFERLMARPSIWQTIQQAQPWFAYYPLKSALPARFLASTLAQQS